MKAKNKKILAGTVALGLVAAVAVGGTFAYLTDETEKRANNFTFPEPISAMLTEPDWDGVVDYIYPDDPNYPDGEDKDIIPVYGWTDDDSDPDTPDVPVFGYEDGDPDKPVTEYGDPGTGIPPEKDDEYGNTTNQNMVPGQSALKDPIITNTSKDIDEWVAAQVSFVYASGEKEGMLLSTADMQAVLDSITIDWNSSVVGDSKKWELITENDDKTQYTFYYMETLDKRPEDAGNGVYGGKTVPIFNSVTVNSDADNADIENLNKIDGGFIIYIEGFAVQSSVAENYTGFKTWGTSGVSFNNSPAADKAADLSLDNGGIVAKQ